MDGSSTSDIPNLTKEICMRRKTLIAISVAAAFALPLTVQAAGDKAKSADTASPSASQGASSSGAEKMFQALDKNKDGAISREEAKGSPHDKDFATLDKNRDGKLTRQEHAAAPEHAGEKAATGSTSAPSGTSGTSGKPKY
jgi:hypothetical protein